jgi:hypothetical protein
MKASKKPLQRRVKDCFRVGFSALLSAFSRYLPNDKVSRTDANLSRTTRQLPSDSSACFLRERTGLDSSRSANLKKIGTSPNSRRCGVLIAGQRGWRVQSHPIKPSQAIQSGRARLRRALTRFLWRKVTARSQNRDGRHNMLCRSLAFTVGRGSFIAPSRTQSHLVAPSRT